MLEQYGLVLALVCAVIAIAYGLWAAPVGAALLSLAPWPFGTPWPGAERMTLRPLVEADIAAGRLIVPFARLVASPYAYYLVMRKAVAARAPVAAFREWLLAEARDACIAGV